MNRLRDERGLSLIEVMAASAITVAVLALLATMFTQTVDVDTYTGRDAEALSVLRTTTDRLAKDLRQAGKIYIESYECSNYKRMVRFWVDEDGDGLQDSGERITWRVSRPEEEEDGRTRLTRRTDDSSGIVYSQEIVWKDPPDYFQYNVPVTCYSGDPDATSAPNPTTISITLVADIDVERSPVERRVRTDVQLRNVPNW